MHDAVLIHGIGILILFPEVGVGGVACHAFGQSQIFPGICGDEVGVRIRCQRIDGGDIIQRAAVVRYRFGTVIKTCQGTVVNTTGIIAFAKIYKGSIEP